jgi:type III secretory pathway component EscT
MLMWLAVVAGITIGILLIVKLYAIPAAESIVESTRGLG